MTEPNEMVNVRYMVDDVAGAIDFYTKLLGFEVHTSFAPAFADVTRGNLRLLLSGPTSSAGRPMPDGAKPGPGGWNRIHLIVDDIDAEVARLREAGLSSATTSSPAPVASRSCWTPPVSEAMALPAATDRRRCDRAGRSSGSGRDHGVWRSPRWPRRRAGLPGRQRHASGTPRRRARRSRGSAVRRVTHADLGESLSHLPGGTCRPGGPPTQRT